MGLVASQPLLRNLLHSSARPARVWRSPFAGDTPSRRKSATAGRKQTRDLVIRPGVLVRDAAKTATDTQKLPQLDRTAERRSKTVFRIIGHGLHFLTPPTSPSSSRFDPRPQTLNITAQAWRSTSSPKSLRASRCKNSSASVPMGLPDFWAASRNSLRVSGVTPRNAQTP